MPRATCRPTILASSAVRPRCAASTRPPAWASSACISAVHGIGGLGKTALAIQYAFAYADFYPGGRWLIGCAGMPGLAAAIRTLDADLGVEFTDAEKLDDTRAAKRILQALQDRAERGAAARAGEPNPPQPRALDPRQRRRRPAAPPAPHRHSLRPHLAARARHHAAGSQGAQPRRRSPPPAGSR